MHHESLPATARATAHRLLEVAGAAHPVRARQHRDASGRQFRATLAPPRSEDRAPGTRAHPQPKPVGLRASPVVRLEGPLGHESLPGTGPASCADRWSRSRCRAGRPRHCSVVSISVDDRGRWHRGARTGTFNEAGQTYAAALKQVKSPSLSSRHAECDPGHPFGPSSCAGRTTNISGRCVTPQDPRRSSGPVHRVPPARLRSAHRCGQMCG
jgi:hypothetical protein